MASDWKAFWVGMRDGLPLMVGVSPFGVIYGVLALSAGLAPLPAALMSSIVFAGSAQFIAAQLLGAGAPALVVALTIALVNLRHLLYSASVAPYLRDLPGRWKIALSYLLTDEVYATVIRRFEAHGSEPTSHMYFLGAGVGLWSVWQAGTVAGIALGAALPASWPLDFALPVTFIAMLVPALRDRPALAAALTAGALALLTLGWPYKLGLLLAGLGGVLAGTLLEARR